jgi:hypothetical protein
MPAFLNMPYMPTCHPIVPIISRNKPIASFYCKQKYLFTPDCRYLLVKVFLNKGDNLNMWKCRHRHISTVPYHYT